MIRSTFLCEDGRDLVVTFYTADPVRVVIVAGRRTIELPQALSASGARYSDGVTTFWNKGDQALFEWANGATHCRVRH
ncbi:MliC family protein [Defluviicoccus vanus]|uniref:MliC family protein n=2 Tax=Defluviicoccus vanus TaxID=111831 RepID=A0A7H1N6J0_9PROT|nr:MliC family protein [Defluviicoccus vanus]